MNITSKTQTETDLLSIENSVSNAVLALSGAAVSLNNAFAAIWSLPDDRLVAVLQWLVINQKLTPLLELHAGTATAINSILDSVEHQGARISTTIPRQFQIDEFGTVTLVPDPPIPPLEEDPPV